jgi:hypothetical protein
LTSEIEKSDAKIIYILNANNKIWETTWYVIGDFIRVIDENLWNKNIDYIFWNNQIPELDSIQKEKFKSDISVKWWDYLILNNDEIEKVTKKYSNINCVSGEYINSKDLYRYNEKIVKDLIEVLK